MQFQQHQKLDITLFRIYSNITKQTNLVNYMNNSMNLKDSIKTLSKCIFFHKNKNHPQTKNHKFLMFTIKKFAIS